MGADIHLFIEYDESKTVPFTNQETSYLFSDGEFLIPRDYELFMVLAGVRAIDDSSPLFSPRGLPEVASIDLVNTFYLHIIENETERLKEEDVLREEAEQWVAKGLSSIRDSWTKKNGFVSDPYNHTPSWLYLREIKAAFAHSNFALRNMPKEFLVVLDTLESLEKYFGKDKARIVFWFDN